MTMKQAVTFGWVAIGALAVAGCGDPAISSTPNPSASASVVDTGAPADVGDDDDASTPSKADAEAEAAEQAADEVAAA